MSPAFPEDRPQADGESLVPPAERGAAPPTLDEVADYVRSAARLLHLTLDAAQVARVAAHLARSQALAAALHEVGLADDLEPAEVFCPAPFPDDHAEASL